MWVLAPTVVLWKYRRETAQPCPRYPHLYPGLLVTLENIPVLAPQVVMQIEGCPRPGKGSPEYIRRGCQRSCVAPS